MLLVLQLIENALKTKDLALSEDFWLGLPDESKADILESIRQIEAGQGVPHEAVMSKIKQRYAK